MLHTDIRRTGICVQICSRDGQVCFGHEAGKLNGLRVRFERNIVIRTLRITLLSDSGYALTGYEY